MTDIVSKLESAKASWIPRILNANGREQWALLPKTYLNTFGDKNLILTFNFQNTKTFNPIRRIPKFYQEVITAYNKSKVIKLTHFKETLTKQTLWGNRYIKYNKNNSMQTLYFREWIKAGILTIGNLRISNGKIDENYIYQQVKNKSNIFREICLLHKALKPHIKDIILIEPCITQHYLSFQNGCTFIDTDQVKTYKSSFFYKLLVQQKCVKPPCELLYKNSYYLNDDDFSVIYKAKVKDIKDTKIAEFNYKVIHKILPCNVNLKRWKKTENDKCSICGCTETIEHLLYECMYAKSIWKEIECIFKININIQDIILSRMANEQFSFLISLISFLIYKDWLIPSLEGNVREIDDRISNIVKELWCRYQSYKCVFGDNAPINQHLAKIMNYYNVENVFSD